MADQMNRNQGQSKSMPSQDLDKSQRSSGNTGSGNQQRDAGTKSTGNNQQQRNEKGTFGSKSNAQQNIDE